MQVAIHAGAAFADEGRLLKSLQINSRALEKNGVALIGPRRYRQVFKPAFDELVHEPAVTGSHERLRDVLPTGPNTRRVIFSSGNFAGETTTALQEGQLYPLAGRRMALLEQVYHDHEVELFMGLRNLGGFIPKILMSLPEETREKIIQDTDLSCLSWIGMIEDIRDLAPGVQITLWSSENTPFIWGDIVRALGDLPEDTDLADEYDLLLSLLDETGQEKVQTLVKEDERQDKGDLRNYLAQVFEDHAQQDKIEEELDLPGWNTEIVDAFSELHEQDLARLATTPGVRILTP
ncbi:hypothetical protein [Ruegeria lacuscaerulensis]|uniref:hypothetical protein n=1 Tax=Ruegeria lacuscaerulensis TaxID=55218 RepID=UPI00147F8662|nr:hypothetical protein [Ruegeria lacuscaerulensis]